jgi:spore maturation protein CgeB
MTHHLTALRDDADLRGALVQSGMETILARHTCAHRVDELLSIVSHLRAPQTTSVRDFA